MQSAMVFDPTQLSYLPFFSLGLQQGDFRKYIQIGVKCKIPPTSIEEDAKQEEKGRPIMLNMDSALNGCKLVNYQSMSEGPAL